MEEERRTEAAAGSGDRPEAALYRYFERIFPDHQVFDSSYRPAVSCLAASPEPVPEDTLRQAFSMTTDRYKDMVRALEGLVVSGKDLFGNGTLGLRHPALAAWLLSDAAGYFRMDPRMGGKVMGRYLVDRVRNAPSHMSEYEAIFLPYFVDRYAPSLAPLGIGVLASSAPYLWRLLDAGDKAMKLKDPQLAGDCYWKALTYAAGWVKRDNTPSARRVCIAALHRAGGNCERLSQSEEAIALYEESLELSRESLMAHVGLDELQTVRISAHKAGEAAKKAGQLDRAREHYKAERDACKKLASVSDRFDKLLGDCCFRLGMFMFNLMKNREAAKFYLKEAVRAYGDHEEARQLKEAVEQILRKLTE